jgi:hypothetical protein
LAEDVQDRRLIENIETMAYVGNWISGHSGTAQKSKKVFARRKQWAKGRLPSEGTNDGERKVVGEYELHPGGNGIADGLFLLLAILLLGACGWWVQGVNASSATASHDIEKQRDGFSDEEKHAYQFLVDSGSRNLDFKDHRLAIYEFNEALKIAPYGKEARLGLLKAMELRCATTGEYCDRAEEQYTFVKEMGWLTKE